jgi:hypothetical protein
MVDLALWLKRNGRRPRQVQDFIPTPMSMATCMYHTGLDPFTMEPVYTATGLRAKRLQKALLLYWNPDEWPLVREALREAGRPDLIGTGPHALVPPEGAGPGRGGGAARAAGPRHGGTARAGAPGPAGPGTRAPADRRPRPPARRPPGV